MYRICDVKMSIFWVKLLTFVLCIYYCSALYEDQVGKFEWRQQFLGKIKFSHVDIVSPIKKVVVATEQNVVAALSLKTGDLTWRQILEQEEPDSIRFMAVGSDVVTLTGFSLPVMRLWDIEHGYIVSEWNAPKSVNIDTKWALLGQKIVQININEGSSIEITTYNVYTGSKISVNKVTEVPITLVKKDKCLIKNNVISCWGDSTLYVIHIVDVNTNVDIKVEEKLWADLSITSILKIESIPGEATIVRVESAEGAVTWLQTFPEVEVLNLPPLKNTIVISTQVDGQTLLSSLTLHNKVLEVKTVTTDGDLVPDLASQLTVPSTEVEVDLAHMICQPRKDRGIACRLLVTTAGHTVMLAQHPSSGPVLWTREESLASIVSVEMVDLPVSETEAAIEKEFANKDYGFIGVFCRRLFSQALQLQNLLLTVAGLHTRTVNEFTADEGLVRDEFGLHKVIVAVTSAGKVFGIDNLSGRVTWQFTVADMQPYSAVAAAAQVPPRHKLPLYVLRTARHLPFQAQCALLTKRRTTGEGLLVIFNPITGELVGPPKPLGHRVKQSLLLHDLNHEFSKALVVMDTKDAIHVYPEGGVSDVQTAASFMFTADPDTAVLEGFILTFHKSPQQPVATKVWQLRLGQQGDKVLAVMAKDPNERVHSQGRVLPDRSVMYKYVNPNLVAVATQSHHPSYKTTLNVYLVDAVTGTIVSSVSHRRARPPLHMVHSENWLLYSYISDKHRRTEFSSLEMYEGKSQSNATAFSSLDSGALLPLVERQSYILGANVLGLKDTMTEKGITSKHILVALSSGGVLQLPWMYVDPRRPLGEPREEAVIPYTPELPIPLEAIINHNQSVHSVRDIHTSVSGLESTCLVFINGLDLFYTRVAPSKTFDLLKEDFDYYLITIVLLALGVGSYATKKLSSRKALKQAWK